VVVVVVGSINCKSIRRIIMGFMNGVCIHNLYGIDVICTRGLLRSKNLKRLDIHYIIGL